MLLAAIDDLILSTIRKMKYLFSLAVVICLCTPVSVGKATTPKRINPCKIFGTVYIEKQRSYADFSIYLEENESFADLPVFLEDNALYADQSGVWFITTNPNQAQYHVYLEKTKSFADFSVFYTNTRSFAGCR